MISYRFNARNHQRPSVRLRSRGFYEVFRLAPGVGPQVTLEEAREAFEICQSLSSGTQREACYAVFGLNGPAVERYLPLLLFLERNIAEGPEMTPEDVAALEWGSYIVRLQRKKPKPRRPRGPQ